MYLLEKKDNVIMHISETLERQEINNYYLIKNGTMAVPPKFVKNIFEVEYATMNNYLSYNTITKYFSRKTFPIITF